MSSRKVREKLREAMIQRDIALEESRIAREGEEKDEKVAEPTPKKKTAKSKNKASQKDK